MAVIITALRPEDHDEWLELWKDYLAFYETELEDATTETTFGRLSTADPTMHGALARDADGRAVGLVHWLAHAATWDPTGYCYLEDLYVSEDARRTGAGEALIEYVRGWAQQHGSSKVYWLTAETNAVARRLYDRVATRSGFIHYEIKL
ncbi:MAG: GNAT family N-acetyltransferase [Marmoricola sp.]